MMRTLIGLLVAFSMTWLIMRWFPQPELPEAQLTGTPTSADVAYHTMVFDYAMDLIEPGAKYDWKTTSVKGVIVADAKYQSKSGSVCRVFRENIEMVSTSGQQEGIACKRSGRDGWCRLGLEDAQTCAMESSRFSFHIGGFNFGGVDMSLPEVGGGPSVGKPGINTSVNAPKVDGPNTDKVRDWLPNKPAHRPSGLAEWMTQ